jgi:hypothetical protein
VFFTIHYVIIPSLHIFPFWNYKLCKDLKCSNFFIRLLQIYLQKIHYHNDEFCIYKNVETSSRKNKMPSLYICFFVFQGRSLLILFFLKFYLFTCAYIVWVISSPTPFFPLFQAEPVLSLSLILLKRRHKHNKEDKAFLLVELRIAIQKDS